MQAGAREIRRRIKSVKNTKKITKAMEMVAAAKMRKAVDGVLATRDYSNLAWEMLLSISERTDTSKHALLYQREDVKKVAIILISSNRGLCGGFNNQIFQKVVESIKKHENIDHELITLGDRGRDALIRNKYEITADFPKEDVILSSAEIAPIAHMIINNYVNNEYDKILIGYTDYASSMSQIPRVKQILPITTQDEYLGAVGKSKGIHMTPEFAKAKQEKHLTKGEFKFEYLFEPNIKKALDELLPRLIEIQIYQAVLESNASEHSARMMAMRQASDAAGEMINDLTLAYNQARQAAITKEIIEISSGKAALEQNKV